LLSQERPSPPTLRLTPTAWAKLLYLRDAGPTEIGGFGISATGEPLLLEDVRLVRQRCDWASVAFEDESVADLFDEQIDLGRRPEEFARIWVHTHPGESPSPSATDEETFARVFGGCDWGVMFILAKGGRSYARLRFGVGPGGALEIPVEVDFTAEFSASDREAWAAEYAACVEPLERPAAAEPSFRAIGDEDWFGGLSELRRPFVEEAEYEAYW
jgi:proteasome lid subunit RPN8/RPN11